MSDQVKVSTGRSGLVLHFAAGYDWLVWLKTWGREGALRERMLGFAQLQAGESVLDVGCGTGTLAIAAKRRVGRSGRVCGVDASPEMIARAARKARRAGLEVAFAEGTAQAIPFPDARFDVVVSTLMLHHLPRGVRQSYAQEMRRVAKPGGRVLIIDFAAAEKRRHGFLAHLHRHGHTRLEEIVALAGDAGLDIVETGPVGRMDMHFVLASVPRQVAVL